LVAGLVVFACLVVVPIDLTSSAVFVVASLTGKDQFSIVHLTSITAC
jgi:hypothetical protein